MEAQAVSSKPQVKTVQIDLGTRLAVEVTVLLVGFRIHAKATSVLRGSSSRYCPLIPFKVSGSESKRIHPLTNADAS